MFVGVDVGGTNTDAVLMDGSELAAAVKLPTTADVTSGIISSLAELLKQLPSQGRVDAVMVGTTHFTNALLERRNLAPTAVMRLALPATQLLPPLVDWPDELRRAIGGEARMVRGGHEFDGREISALDRDAVRETVRELSQQGIRAIAVSGVFSPVNNSHELEVASIVQEEDPGDARVPVPRKRQDGTAGAGKRGHPECVPGRDGRPHPRLDPRGAGIVGDRCASLPEPERRHADGRGVCGALSGSDHLLWPHKQYEGRGLAVGGCRRHRGGRWGHIHGCWGPGQRLSPGRRPLRCNWPVFARTSVCPTWCPFPLAEAPSWIPGPCA